MDIDIVTYILSNIIYIVLEESYLEIKYNNKTLKTNCQINFQWNVSDN